MSYRLAQHKLEVIDGPKAGEWIACEQNSFDVLTGDPTRGTEARLTYRLCRLGDGYVWRCGTEAVTCTPGPPPA